MVSVYTKAYDLVADLLIYKDFIRMYDVKLQGHIKYVGKG